MGQHRSIIDLAEPATVQKVQASLLDVLTRGFCLREEEVAWTAYRISVILSPFGSLTVSHVPVAALSPARPAATAQTGTATALPVAQVGLDAWTASLSTMVEAAYGLDGIEATAVRAQLAALLSDLGIGHPTHPRPARYIPRDVFLQRHP